MADPVMERLTRKRTPSTPWMGDGGSLTSYTPTARERITDFLARNWYGDNREGTRQAERLMGVADVTPLGLAPMAYDIGREGAQGNYAGAGLNLAMAMAPMPKPKGIRAFHGSPHDFERFSMDRIGTGEGAQAYGHGLYFAENENVATGYRDALSDTKDFYTSTGKRMPSWIAKSVTGYDFIHNPTTEKINPRQIAEIRSDFQRRLAQSKAELDAGDWNASERVRVQSEILAALDDVESGASVSRPGRMYEVNINADPNDFLDWDKPFSSADDLERFAAKFDSVNPTIRKIIEDYGYFRQQNGLEMPDGEDLVREVFGSVEGANARQGSKYLTEAGIPGIKYLDAGSRSKGDGSRNYVVFDDKLVEIVRKYGIAGASAMLGYNLLDGTDEAQAAQLKQAQEAGMLSRLLGRE